MLAEGQGRGREAGGAERGAGQSSRVQRRQRVRALGLSTWEFWQAALGVTAGENAVTAAGG